MRNKMSSLNNIKEKVNLDEIKVRKATASDFQEVLDINQDIYSGFDYVPSLYFVYLHHPDIYTYVLEWKGRILGFFALWMLEDRTYACAMSGRVIKGNEKQGIFSVVDMVDLAAKELGKPFRIIATAWYNERLHSAHNAAKANREILLTWNNMRFTTPSAKIRNYTFAAYEVEHFNIEKTVSTLLSPETIKLLKADSDIIIAFNQWLPLHVTASNLIWLAKASDCVQFSFEDEACVAVSFCFQIPLRHKTNLIDITYFGRKDSLLCSSHVLNYMSHIKGKSICSQYRFILHVPFSINDDQVEEMIKSVFGDRLKEDRYPPRAVCYQSLQTYQAKL